MRSSSLSSKNLIKHKINISRKPVKYLSITKDTLQSFLKMLLISISEASYITPDLRVNHFLVNPEHVENDRTNNSEKSNFDVFKRPSFKVN